MGKYLIQISIRELHNDLITSKNEGKLSEFWKGNKLLVSNTDLRYIIVINITQFTPGYKKMCGSGVCIQSTQL